MARQEQDREDLIAEATALVQRAELRLPDVAEPVVIGFRPPGAASLYVGGDEAWHFNAAGQLRRAFLDGVLYKAQRGRLVALRRQRMAEAVALVAQPLDIAGTAQLLERLQQRRGQLEAALQLGTLHVLRQVPATWDVSATLRTWLAAQPGPPVADRPHVR